MQNLILTLHIIVCVLLVILVLLQSGKEGMGVIFGGGNSSVFGSAGAGGILAKLTALMGVIFIITSLSYTYVTSSRPTSDSAVLKVRIEEDVPATPPTESDSAKTAPAESSSEKEPMQTPAADGSAPVSATEPASQTPEPPTQPAPASSQSN